ncbi:MAG: hypothetical protein ABJJ53_06865 [Sulfitobacter sp.]
MPKSTITLLLFLFSAGVAQADIRLFGNHPTIHLENMGVLTQNQRDGLEKFQMGKPYCGAIFVEKGGSGWGSFTGAHNMNDAMEAAIRICQHHADAGKCTLAGIIYPEDMTTANIPQDTLSQRASDKFRIYSSRSEGHRAFAKSQMNSFGWATRRDTAQQAIEAALTFCYTSSMKALMKLQVGLRAKALEDGLYTCRIIDHAKPNADPS